MSKEIENIKALIEQINADREKRLSLPVKERYKLMREDGVKKLLYLGYIEEAEAGKYREPLSELPTDRKGLIIAYFLSGFYDSEIIETEDYENIREATKNLNLRSKLLSSTDRLIDVCSPEELESYKRATTTALYDSQLRRAETFVDATRKRLREIFLQAIKERVASALLDEPVKEKGELLDRTPYLREIAIENGYRPKAKTINDTDRQALETASRYYLDLLELILLTGEGDRRREEIYPKYLSEDGSKWDDNFYYEDEIDEALTELTDIYGGLEELISNYYNGGDNSQMARIAKEGLFRHYSDYKDGEFIEVENPEEDFLLQRLSNSKFNYLIQERNVRGN